MENELIISKEYLNLEKLLNNLNINYLTKYSKSVTKVKCWWYTLQIITSICTILFAIFSSIAIAYSKEMSGNKLLNISMIVIPSLSSAISSLIIKFRIQDLWMMREHARIDFQNLYNDGLYKLSTSKTLDELNSCYKYLIENINKIEDEQQTRFFTNIKTDINQNNKNI